MNSSPASCEFPDPLSGETKRRWLPKLAFFLAALVLVAWIYLPVRHFELVNFDDFQYIGENPMLVHGFTPESVKWAFVANLTEPSKRAEYWEPLTLLSRIADAHFFGMSSGAFHLSSAVIHLLNGLLLCAALWRLTGSWNRSAFVALLFLVHPMNVEAACWLSARKDLLSATFSFVTLIAYAYYARRPSLGRYGLLLGAFLLALMSKPMGVSLPFIFLALDFWPLGRWQKAAGNREAQGLLVAEKLPLLIFAFSAAIFAVASQEEVGAMRSLDACPYWARLCNALISYATYVRRVFWPSDLAIFYLHPAKSISVWHASLAGMFLLFVFAVAYRFRRQVPYLWVGWLWFGLALGPVIGLVQIGSQSMADRYAYPSTIGLFIALVWGVSQFLRGQRAALLALGTASVVAMSLVASRQVLTWQDSVTLFTQDLLVAGPSSVAYDNLAEGLQAKGRIDEAFVYCLRRKDLFPGAAISWFSLAVLEGQRGHQEESLKFHKEALRRDGNFVQSLVGVAEIDFEIGRKDEAAILMERVLQLKPGEPIAVVRLAQIYGENKQWLEVARVWDAYLQHDPSDSFARKSAEEARQKAQAQLQEQVPVP